MPAHFHVDLTVVPHAGALDVFCGGQEVVVAALQFDIGYAVDSVGLSVSSGGVLAGADKTLYTADPQSGSKRILIAGLNQNTIGDGVIATLSVQVRLGVAPGVYPLAIGNGAASDGSGTAVSVTLSAGSVIVPGDGVSAPAILSVLNAASYLKGPVAPGELIAIEGTGWNAASGARALFEGIPASILSVTQNQLSAIVPNEVDGRSVTSLQVERQGIRSAPFLLQVARASPAIFTLNQSGVGQGAILNEDGAVNGPGNPAARGSVISIFGTGEGRLILPVAVSIGGQAADVLYAGTQGPGLFQVNARIPLAASPGDAVPVTVTIGSPSQPGVTLSVK